MTHETISVWRLRPNGRGDFVRVDEWACDALMSSGFNVGFIGPFDKQPYPWVGRDQSDPSAPMARASQRLHTWVWDRALETTISALAEVLAVVTALGHRPLIELGLKHLALVAKYQRTKGTVIHHVNEREADNRLVNLKSMETREHNRHHAKERKTKARTTRLNKYVTTGSGWWQDKPVTPGRRLPLFHVRLVSRGTGDVAWVRPLPDGSPCDYQSEAGRFLEGDAQALVKEYTESMPAWDYSLVQIDSQTPGSYSDDTTRA